MIGKKANPTLNVYEMLQTKSLCSLMDSQYLVNPQQMPKRVKFFLSMFLPDLTLFKTL